MGYDLVGEESYEQDFYKKSDTKTDTGGYVSSDVFVYSLKKRGIKIGEKV